jgi:hypothetical protein
MLGFFSFCAATGVLATVTAANFIEKFLAEYL